MQSARCQGCGAINTNNTKVCEYCGAVLSSAGHNTNNVIRKISYYKEYSDVPDFGFITEIPLIKTSKDSNTGWRCTYFFYDRRFLTQIKVDEFLDIMTRTKYSCNGYDDAIDAFEFTHKNRSVYLTIADDELYICINDSL